MALERINLNVPAEMRRRLRAVAKRLKKTESEVARDPRGNAPRPPGNLTNRSGGREQLLAGLNQDFMPLAKECIEHAQEQSPEMAGMLVIGVETVADEALGAVVELAEAAPNNQTLNPDLLECIRQTAFSLQLPPPPVGGREKFEISLRIAPASTAARDS